MAKPYSMDLRERVVASVEREGLSRHEAAARFGVAPSSAIKWVQRYRALGSVAPGRMGGHKPRVLRDGHRDWLLERTRRDFTLRGLVAELAERGIKVDYRQVWEFVHAEGLSFKKKRAAVRAAPAQNRETTRAVEEVPEEA
jgi:putative transposase